MMTACCWSRPTRHRQGRGALHLAPLELHDAGAARGTRRLGSRDSGATRGASGRISLRDQERVAALHLSHHGEIDRGALRRPASPEAIVLHYLDELDARLEQAWRLIDQGLSAEEWTAYVPSLERQLYRFRPSLPPRGCPLADELDPCPPTNGVRCLESSTEAKLRASVENNGHR